MAWLLAGLSGVVACGASEAGGAALNASAERGGRTGSAGTTATAGAGSGGAPSSGGSSAAAAGGNVVAVGSAGEAGQQGRPTETCLADSRQGTRKEVALLFMVDISRSMYCPVDLLSCDGDASDYTSVNNRWEATRGALEAFFGAPRNAGLWAGMGFFPHTIVDQPVCDASDYADPAEELGQLPGAAAALTDTLDKQLPDGSTPTRPALEGALSHARAWGAEHPELRVAVVLATDGYPHQCDAEGNTIGDAAAVAESAYLTTPSIATYVLAIGQNLNDVSQIAEAGGTTRALIVDSSKTDVATQLLAALGTIGDEVFLNCTYTIPEPPNGEQLDLGLVNVRYTTSNGEELTILQDPTEGECGEGWQYSADRTEIHLCGDACETVKQDAGGRLDVLFGCQTEVAPQPK